MRHFNFSPMSIVRSWVTLFSLAGWITATLYFLDYQRKSYISCNSFTMQVPLC